MGTSGMGMGTLPTMLLMLTTEPGTPALTMASVKAWLIRKVPWNALLSLQLHF